MNYFIYGEFPITRNGALVSRAKADKRDFWEKVEAAEKGLSGACGCYIFMIRNRAWYIGMAERQTFRQECFTPHKINQYNEALGEVGGKPSMLLLPKLTPGGRFANPKKQGHADIQMLESLLIGSALKRNHNLRNVRDTKLLREMNVPGFLNTRQGQARALIVQTFKRAVGA